MSNNLYLIAQMVIWYIWNKCSLWCIIYEQKSFNWYEVSPARYKLSLVMLRTIQSGSIVVGVGPSCMIIRQMEMQRQRACGVLFSVIFTWFQRSEKKKRHAISSLLLCNCLWNAKSFTLPWMRTTLYYCNHIGYTPKFALWVKVY